MTDFLVPKNINLPSQGAFKVTPHVDLLEDTTMAGLQTQLDGTVAGIAVLPGITVHVEQIQYVVALTSPPMPTMLYSVAIFYWEIEQI